MLTYFIFRIKQLFRFIQSGGLGIILLIPLAFLFIVKLESIFTILGPIYTQMAFCTLIFFLHNNRKDLAFINITYRGKSWILLVLEYSFTLTGLNIIYISLIGWSFYSMIGMLFILLLPFYKSNLNYNQKIIKNITGRIPDYIYEWRTFFRKQFLVPLLVYLVGLIVIPFTPITPIFIVLWVFFSVDMYKFEEPHEIIQSYKKIKIFKKLKIQKALIALNILLSPHIIIFLIYYPTNWLYLLVSIIIAYLFFLYAFLGRYFFSKINHQVNNNIPLIIFGSTIIILPLSIYLIFQAWNKTKLEIKRLLA